MSETTLIEQELKDFALFSNPSLTQADADYLYLVFQKRKEQNAKMVLEVLDKTTNKTYRCNHLGIFIIDGLIVSNKETLDKNKYTIKEVQHELNKFYVGQKVVAGPNGQKYEGVVFDIWYNSVCWMSTVIFDEEHTFLHEPIDGEKNTTTKRIIWPLKDSVPA